MQATFRISKTSGPRKGRMALIGNVSNGTLCRKMSLETPLGAGRVLDILTVGQQVMNMRYVEQATPADGDLVTIILGSLSGSNAYEKGTGVVLTEKPLTPAEEADFASYNTQYSPEKRAWLTIMSAAVALVGMVLYALWAYF